MLLNVCHGICTDVYVPQKMNPNYFDNHFTSPLPPPWGWHVCSLWNVSAKCLRQYDEVVSLRKRFLQWFKVTCSVLRHFLNPNRQLSKNGLRFWKIHFGPSNLCCLHRLDGSYVCISMWYWAHLVLFNFYHKYIPQSSQLSPPRRAK